MRGEIALGGDVARGQDVAGRSASTAGIGSNGHLARINLPVTDGQTDRTDAEKQPVLESRGHVPRDRTGK